MSSPANAFEALNGISQKIRHDFDIDQRILTFDEYLQIVASHPEKQLRGSAQFTADMMDHFGKDTLQSPLSETEDRKIYRFHIYDQPIDGMAPKLLGHERVQTEIYHALRNFSRQGLNNRMILLHGPNGSAKSTLVRGLMSGIEKYSYTTQGACYTFNWVFPIERLVKGSVGIQNYANQKAEISSYAKLAEDEIAATLPSDLKDHPILLIPSEFRKSFLEEIVGKDKIEAIWSRLPIYLSEGNLSHKNKEIFEALLKSYVGDYRKVLMHIQVERIYLSRRYRHGLVTIEPQLHVDGQYQQLTMNKSISALPITLQSLNLFKVSGDLVDGNRGIIEFSDLLKRPIDSFKYLLGVCETGSIGIGNSIAYLDTVLIGNTNELQLDAFREFPDYSSFKARFYLIRVPYLLSYTKEKELYNLLLPKLKGDKPVSPHTDLTLALWAVLTRLKKPNSIHYTPNLSGIISRLTPIEKARVYDRGELPNRLTPDERKLLRSNLRKLRDEYTNIPYYEGRTGASVREIKAIIADATQDNDFPCLSPLAILKSLEHFVKQTNEHDFLKQDVKDGYHDAGQFIDTVREEYLNIIDQEVRESIGLYDSAQWEDFIKKYVHHIAALLKSERIYNPVTGKAESPDNSLIKEFEKMIEAPKTENELKTFRTNVISQVGAWSLDHPNVDVKYREVFPQYWAKIEKHYYEQQKQVLVKMNNSLARFNTESDDTASEGSRLARKTVDNMVKTLGYTEAGAIEAITHLMQKRY